MYGGIYLLKKFLWMMFDGSWFEISWMETMLVWVYSFFSFRSDYSLVFRIFDTLSNDLTMNGYCNNPVRISLLKTIKLI